MATWVALFLARPRGTARAASTSLPFAGVSSGSLSSPEVVVVLQFCLNLFGCASGEHPRSGTRQEKWCLCVPGGFRWVENYLQDRSSPNSRTLHSDFAISWLLVLPLNPSLLLPLSLTL